MRICALLGPKIVINGCDDGKLVIGTIKHLIYPCPNHPVSAAANAAPQTRCCIDQYPKNGAGLIHSLGMCPVSKPNFGVSMSEIRVIFRSAADSNVHGWRGRLTVWANGRLKVTGSYP